MNFVVVVALKNVGQAFFTYIHTVYFRAAVGYEAVGGFQRGFAHFDHQNFA